MTTPNSIHTLLFVDRNIENYQTLIANVQEGTEVILLDTNLDGVEQITSVLAKRSNIASVQVISHGSEGEVQLGSTLLNTETIANYRHLLGQWRNSLTENADILLFGCDVASGVGEEFLQQLSEITGADIAASTDITGNQDLGGDWELEVQTGSIESSLALPTETLTTFNSVLGNVGEGLLGFYFDNNNLNTQNSSKFIRVDDNLNFDWGFGKADNRLTQFDFSAYWDAQLIAPSAGIYISISLLMMAQH
jgi:hypothetical protein